MPIGIRDFSLSDHRSDAGISKWIAQLNVSIAPMTRLGVKTALAFFQNRMPTLPPQMAFNFLLAMDLSKRVNNINLRLNEELLAFRSPSEPEFKLFHTRPGASKHNSGVNPAGRVAVQYQVHQSCPALESYTTGAIDVWSIPASGQMTTVAPRSNSTGVMAMGGGIQLIIPDASRYLTLQRVGTNP